MAKTQMKTYVGQETKDTFKTWYQGHGFRSESEALDALVKACNAGEIEYKKGSFK